MEKMGKVGKKKKITFGNTKDTKNTKKEWSLVSLGVLGKDCSESKLSPQPLLSSTVASGRMQLYKKLTKSLAVKAEESGYIG